jgi:hypothetical protein
MSQVLSTLHTLSRSQPFSSSSSHLAAGTRNFKMDIGIIHHALKQKYVSKS